ncbi:MAG: sigma factor-like helix-turn-helix DNA-binding protein [Planctomycetaceae bacterium]
MQNQKQDVAKLVTKGFNRNERLIVILYYYEELTMKEIGQMPGCPSPRASQMGESSIVCAEGTPGSPSTRIRVVDPLIGTDRSNNQRPALTAVGVFAFGHTNDGCNTC